MPNSFEAHVKYVEVLTRIVEMRELSHQSDKPLLWRYTND